MIANEVGLVNAFTTIYSTALQLNKTVKHHVFSNGKMCSPPTNYYCKMHAALVSNGTKFWSEAKEQETLELMIRSGLEDCCSILSLLICVLLKSADMNVNSGSSFPIMAAALAPGLQTPFFCFLSFCVLLIFWVVADSQLVVMLPPKEAIRNQGPHVWETYDRGDALRATVFGVLLQPEELKRRMAAL